MSAEPGTAPDAGRSLRDAVERVGRKLVVLDDDPTGVQTVHDIAVLTRWSVADLAAELCREAPGFFILTNTRSMAPERAIAVTTDICTALRVAAAETNVALTVASRGDSTLRGHFPEETDAIATVLGGPDAVLLCPAFIEGGRVTIDDVHYVQDDAGLVPVNRTEFAWDDTFGYRHANLRDWIAEKSGGRIDAGTVGSLTLREIREGGQAVIQRRLQAARDGCHLIVNAETYADLEVVALAAMRAERAGKRFVYRCGASFVRARLGQPARPLLTVAELNDRVAPAPASPGLVVVGSHVARTRQQLRRLLELPGLAPLEVPVPEILADAESRGRAIDRVAALANDSMRSGATPVIHTSPRQSAPSSGTLSLAQGRQVSAALVEIVRQLTIRPSYVLAKGGITSSDIGTEALEARRALVLGQLLPGVPVWRLGPETRYPGAPYIIFPGNVGDDASLATIVASLQDHLVHPAKESPCSPR